MKTLKGHFGLHSKTVSKEAKQNNNQNKGMSDKRIGLGGTSLVNFVSKSREGWTSVLQWVHRHSGCFWISSLYWLTFIFVLITYFFILMLWFLASNTPPLFFVCLFLSYHGLEVELGGRASANHVPHELWIFRLGTEKSFGLFLYTIMAQLTCCWMLSKPSIMPNRQTSGW